MHPRSCAAGLSIVLLAFAGAARGDDQDEIKRLIPAATSMRKADLQKLGAAEAPPRVEDIADKSLTLMLMALEPPQQRSDEHKAEFDYIGDTPPSPTKLAAEISGGRFSSGPATFIHANRITNITCEVTGDKAAGVVSYKVPDLYQGKINYVARRKDGAWQITELSMPAHKIHIVRGENGLWMERD